MSGRRSAPASARQHTAVRALHTDSRLGRLRSRCAAVPLARWRNLLLAIYVGVAAVDAGGKALASSGALERILGPHAAHLGAGSTPETRRQGGNFEIFRLASRHLLSGEDLYARYPEEVQDRYKYSPAFALIFVPFAVLPPALALFLWSLLNAGALFLAVERVLPPRAALLALAALLPEALRAMQNAQSNALVAALIIAAFAFLERRRHWRAAAAIALGASVKIFPLAALAFAVPRRVLVRLVGATVLLGALLLLMPLVVTTPGLLLTQYASWRAIEATDALQRLFSLMQLMQHAIGGGWPNWPVQLAGIAALLAPLLLSRDRWTEPRFRLLYLCSLLVFVVLFNHQAERASYVISMTGIALWYFCSPRAIWRDALVLLAFATVTLMSTLLPVPASFKAPSAMLLRLTIPTLAVWLAIQWELLRGPDTFLDANRHEVHATDESATSGAGSRVV